MLEGQGGNGQAVVFYEPSDRLWAVAWDSMAHFVDREYQEAGECWQFMGAWVAADGGHRAEFRHRMYHGTRQTLGVLIPAEVVRASR